MAPTIALEPLIMSGSLELLSALWMEVAMAGLAAIVYFSLTGFVPPSSKSGSGRGTAAGDEACPTPIKEALRHGKISEAAALILKEPSMVPGSIALAHVAPRLLLAAARATDPEEQLAKELEPLLGGEAGSEAVEAAITEMLRRKDATGCRRLDTLASCLGASKTSRTLECLAKAYGGGRRDLLRGLVEEAGSPLPRAVAKAVLEACTPAKDAELAALVFEHIDERDSSYLRAVVERAAGGARDRPSPRAGASKDEAHQQHAKTIRQLGKNGNLHGALATFDRLAPQARNTLLYNSLLDACVACGALDKALHYFAEAKEALVADVVSYNTLMKGHLAAGDEAAAEVLLRELRERGLTATHATYHGLLNARAAAGDGRRAWQVVADMQSAGVQPNAVTCSILLKGSFATSSTGVSRVLSLVDSMNQPMDEVLFSSVADACIRTGRLDLLRAQLARFREHSSSPLSAPTYGSMIKAFGQGRDVKRTWALWEEMGRLQVRPTQITLGCMVEALVTNGENLPAWQLVQKLWSDESMRPLINTVIYSTILKGFANSKQTERVMMVYEEMQARSCQPNTITYNTMLDAFAQAGEMHRVGPLLEEMKTATPQVEPDVVTYSTIIKGFCSSGNLDQGLELLREVKADGKYAPDEVMYNSLLGGCAKEQRLDEALQLVEDMKRAGIAPSNYTLSIMVKLLGRCRRLGQAFSMVEATSREFKLKVNIQVYTCLIQACFNNRQVGKALAVHDQAVKEGLYFDEMACTALVRGCMQAGCVDKALQMAKSAYGLSQQASRGREGCRPAGINSKTLQELVAKLGKSSSEAQALLAAASTQQDAAPASHGGRGSARNATTITPPWHQRRS